MAENPPVGPYYNATLGIFHAPASGGAAPWLLGWLGTWFILSLMADNGPSADLASALAISIALAATFVLGKDAAANLRTKGL